MEWLTGLALLPVLVCGAMMGGMALMGVLGLRRKHDDLPESRAQDAPQDRESALR
jgi:hypothetical protein